MQLRIGQGFDLHRTQIGRPLVVGGVHIPSPWGLAGHSDADVLLHAITDAFLGALAIGDIGRLYPDNDPQYLNADSAVLLRKAIQRQEFQDWSLVNLDCTIIAEKPKFAPWRDAIIESIANILDCATSQISVKAKTNEGQDAIGQQLAIGAAAIVLLVKDS